MGWSKFARAGWLPSRSTRWFLFWLCVILVVSLVLLYGISEDLNPLNEDWIPNMAQGDWTSRDSAEIYAYWLSGLATALLVVIAYLQVGQMNKDDRANFFLEIDKRWTSEEIMRAKEIITEVEIQHSDKNGIRKTNKVREEIFKLLDRSKSVPANKIKERAKTMASLVNFLDFMETIGFLYSEQYLQYKEVDAVCGESLAYYYYEIFSDYIEKQRKLTNNPDMYRHFQGLFKADKE